LNTRIIEIHRLNQANLSVATYNKVVGKFIIYFNHKMIRSLDHVLNCNSTYLIENIFQFQIRLCLSALTDNQVLNSCLLCFGLIIYQQRIVFENVANQPSPVRFGRSADV